MSVKILRGNALALPLADNSVDMVVTSPPYFGLRSYQDGGEHYDGQIGDEATPAEFVDALIAATAEMVRVVKPSGSIFVNLGDKYAGGTAAGWGLAPGAKYESGNQHVKGTARRGVVKGMPAKSLVGIPWRYALRCIDDLGLILRAEIIWAKPNGLPESVTDRVRRSHEQWFCFEQSSDIKAEAQSFPFCPLCGRPVDARSTLVARLQEVDRSVEPGDLSHEVRPDVRVDGEDAARGDHDVAVGLGGTPVPVLEALDAEAGVDAAHLVEDGVVAVVDADPQQRPALSSDERDGALPVDDSSEPSDVCQCVGHPLIIDDEPWIPQSLAAEVMQLVADGECDPQQAADFLSGDYVRNHSVWFHFTLSPRYYSAVDEIREPHAEVSLKRAMPHRANPGRRGVEVYGDTANAQTLDLAHMNHPLGKLPGSVWTIPTEPLHVPEHVGVDHFAAFPTEWPRRIIQGWSPAGVCVACGEGRRPVVSKEKVGGWLVGTQGTRARGASVDGSGGEKVGNVHHDSVEVTITGHECGCDPDRCRSCKHTMASCLHPRIRCCQSCTHGTYAPTRPGTVLDPFGGTGTTALVADALGRNAIHVDMSADYCRLATWRTTDPKQRAKAARREFKPPTVQLDGQLDLLDGLGA